MRGLRGETPRTPLVLRTVKTRHPGNGPRETRPSQARKPDQHHSRAGNHPDVGACVCLVFAAAAI
jgi:hypothetical protein